MSHTSLVLLLAAVPSPQEFGPVPCPSGAEIHTLGLATPGADGLLELTLEGAPIPGYPFRFVVRHGPPLGAGALLFSPTTLPVELLEYGATLYPNLPLFASLFATDGWGTSAPLLELSPAEATLCGVAFVAQAGMLDAVAQGGVSVSRAAEVRFGAAGAGPLLLLLEATYPVGNNQVDSVIADLDGDQRADLAVLGQAPAAVSEAVSVLLGTGDGGFLPTQYVETGSSSPGHMALGDMNLDGHPDIAATGGLAVHVLLGLGDGTFAAPLAPHCGPASNIAIADANGDGFQDLFCTRSLGAIDDVQVVLGLGDGTLLAPQDYPVARDPVDLAVGDLNADGFLDLATANLDGDSPGSEGSVSTLLGLGDGTFGASTVLPTGTPSSSFTVKVRMADLGLDGALDLVALVDHAPSESVCHFTGNGDGTLQPPVSHDAGTLVFDLEVVDLDRDLLPDVVLSTLWEDAGIRVLNGTPDGTLLPFTPFDVGPPAWTLAVGDLDGDLLPDLALGLELHNVAVVVRHGLLD